MTNDDRDFIAELIVDLKAARAEAKRAYEQARIWLDRGAAAVAKISEIEQRLEKVEGSNQ